MFKKTKNQPNNRPRNTNRNSTESFRRNNTVISRSQREMEQRQQSVTQRQYDRKKQESNTRIKRKVIAIICLALILFVAQRMRISDVKIDSNASSKLSKQQAETYGSSILKDYNKNTLLGQYWTLDEVGMNEAVKSEFPELKSVKFDSKVPFSTIMNSELTFRKAVFTWQDASGKIQFIDSDGVLFDKNLDGTVDTKKLVAIEDQSGTVLEPGNPVLTTGLVKFIGSIHGAIKPVFGGKNISKVIIPKSTREVQIQMTDVPYLVKFSSQRSVEQQISELTVLLSWLKQKNITPVSYIDLRLEHKAFYK